jgi:hypothetical protein
MNIQLNLPVDVYNTILFALQSMQSSAGNAILHLEDQRTQGVSVATPASPACEEQRTPSLTDLAPRSD